MNLCHLVEVGTRSTNNNNVFILIGMIGCCYEGTYSFNSFLDRYSFTSL